MTDDLYAGATDLEGRAIREIVALALDAPARAQSGHSGTAMALAPLGVTLFSRLLRHDPADPTWPDRDRFVLSAGHASMLQYSLAYLFGYDVTSQDLEAFRQPHSKTPGHPERGVTPTVEVTTGPLGQGLANAVGLALAERILRADYGEDLVGHRTWVIAGDGCLEEGISHEAASLAGVWGLDRLTVFYDDNHITIDGPTELARADDTPARFRAYGWNVIELGESANNLEALEHAGRAAMDERERPTLVVVRSHIGFPSPEMQDRREAHGAPFSPTVISDVKARLGLDDVPFPLDPTLPGLLRESVAAKSREHRAWEAAVAAAGERGARLRAQLASAGALTGDAAAPPYAAGSRVATRKALQRALDTWAPATPGLTAGSADLTENTGVRLPGPRQSREDPAGRQIHYGVREFAMAAILVGQASHGGVRPFGSTFFVFSDYARPALRLAALSEAPATFVFTHDSVAVGEDGPTHQPVEHLMSLRAMPNLHVVRPGDANETLRVVEALLRDPSPRPTALVLSRQDVPVWGPEEAAASAAGVAHGGYVVRERDDARFSLMATGSEVATCLEAADALEAEGIAVRVVALPCWTCFAAQPASYQASVLRRDVPSVSLEAGATLGWHRYVDDAIGIDRFGLSAPGSYAMTHLAMTADTVVDHVRTRLELQA